MSESRDFVNLIYADRGSLLRTGHAFAQAIPGQRHRRRALVNATVGRPPGAGLEPCGLVDGLTKPNEHREPPHHRERPTSHGYAYRCPAEKAFDIPS